MRKMMGLKWIVIALIGLLILTGCVQQAPLPQTGVGSTTTPTQTAQNPPPTQLPPTLTPGNSGPGSVGETIDVTPADGGKTITLQVGQAFLLNLGEGYNWTVTIADQSIISREIGVLTIRGSQGLFKAHKLGQTTLEATGDPTCLQSKPPCLMPSRIFTLTILVK